MKRLTKRVVIFFLATLFTGCATIYKRIDPGGNVTESMFQPGETHFYTVLDELGPPGRFSKTPGGFVMLYEDMLIRELQAGISGRTGFFRLIKLSFADSNLYRNIVMLRFNRHGILVSQSISERREDLGTSGSLQPIFSVKQLVDTGAYEDDASEPLDWGMTLLRSLPQTLNNRQSLNSGYAGLEQSGTTTKVGQHTLEMR